jgi:hypothetical protein
MKHAIDIKKWHPVQFEPLHRQAEIQFNRGDTHTAMVGAILRIGLTLAALPNHATLCQGFPLRNRT